MPQPTNQYMFEDRRGDRFEIINTREKIDTCRKLDLEQLSCTHALAVNAAVRIKRFKLWNKMYITDALRAVYDKTIHSVGDQSN